MTITVRLYHHFTYLWQIIFRFWRILNAER